MPGNCWPMIGSHGYVVVNLAFPVRPTMFTLEHLPKTLSFDGQSRSAPKEFSVRVRKDVIFQNFHSFFYRQGFEFSR